jgi:hypothetical protein
VLHDILHNVMRGIVGAGGLAFALVILQIECAFGYNLGRIFNILLGLKYLSAPFFYHSQRFPCNT